MGYNTWLPLANPNQWRTQWEMVLAMPEEIEDSLSPGGNKTMEKMEIVWGNIRLCHTSWNPWGKEEKKKKKSTYRASGRLKENTNWCQYEWSQLNKWILLNVRKLLQKSPGVYREGVKSEMKIPTDTLSGANEAHASGWGKWMTERIDSSLYTIDSSQHSDSSAFQRHENYEKESFHHVCICSNAAVQGPCILERERWVPLEQGDLSQLAMDLLESESLPCWAALGSQF